MADDINQHTIIGRLGQDPELRYTQSGTAICTLSVATGRTWGGRDGSEKKEETTWHRVKLWARLGEIASEYLTKGDQVYIQGRIEHGQYEGQDGVTRYTSETVAETMRMLSPKRDGTRPAPKEKPAQPAESPPPQAEADFDDDIPF